MSRDSSASIVSKVWNYAPVLKNAGVGYGDCVEQITCLLFLKLADEMTELGRKVAVASRRSSWILDQRRDASATIADHGGKGACLIG